MVHRAPDKASVQGWITHPVGSAHSSPMANGTDVLCRLEVVHNCAGRRLCKAADKQSVSSVLGINENWSVASLKSMSGLVCDFTEEHVVGVI